MVFFSWSDSKAESDRKSVRFSLIGYRLHFGFDLFRVAQIVMA